MSQFLHLAIMSFKIHTYRHKYMVSPKKCVYTLTADNLFLRMKCILINIVFIIIYNVDIHFWDILYIHTRVEYLVYNMCLTSSSDKIKNHRYVVKVVIILQGGNREKPNDWDKREKVERK